ncbi:cytochrome P450 [Pacificimonas flava]|uniref:Cytochrome P450 n=2 Tax=Pacificimonas TaxID=1960290 RepID=A0A219B7G0_9SPHN|nr:MULTISPECIES: cytochrome P450 [Pacificimonas]MBZ6378373.1 cytochrome P450 [Pacificimonas aurantium]OWV34320.1 cytochrome P450 [Pacificimonas flava]
MNAPVDQGEFRTDDGSTYKERFGRLRTPSFEDLSHLPNPGKPSFLEKLNSTRRFLFDTLALQQERRDRMGNVYVNVNLGGVGVNLIGPEANEMVLMNRDKIFSSEQGWMPVLEKLFPHGLMLMDFEQHRTHRKALQVAFKPGPMQNYLGQLQEGIKRRLAEWPEKLKLYPAVKQLTLDLAAPSFLGIPWGPEADRINTAFVDMVQASVAPIRKPLPFTQMRKGVKGRAYISEYFASEIPKRRGSDREDIFTQVVNAEDDDGQLLTDQEIIDHMNFLMMAAHDTITSSLSSTIFYLGKTPEWQDRVREECAAIRADVGDTLPYDRLNDFDVTEMAFKEAMRLWPPVPFLPRRALKDFSYGNYTIPAGTGVSIIPMLVHRDPEIWDDPERYDPSRHTREEEKKRHKHAFVPFGGGAHMCLGLHFAYMQAKTFFFELMDKRKIEYPEGYEPKWQMVPIPRPRDNLPTRLPRL